MRRLIKAGISYFRNFRDATLCAKPRGKEPLLVRRGTPLQSSEVSKRQEITLPLCPSLNSSAASKTSISQNPQEAPWALYVDASDPGIGTQLYDHMNNLRSENSMPNLLHIF
eukprot:GHVP01036060.1.p1 GENE.GHVP01036060.1~~GHVP01036060.1.p1  ORF type:complete len:112 (-),score=8.71 GHVP01036060.1:362-697(-)